MADYFISDTHFKHRNIVRGISQWEGQKGCRDFDTLDEHDNKILDGINSVVGPDDTLRHLGDWSFGSVANVAAFRAKINCRNIILIYGNHDRNIRRDRALRDLFVWTGDMRSDFFGKQYIVQCHYAFQVWEDNNRGAFMLHGHSHDALEHDPKCVNCGHQTSDGKILDVCVEGHDCKPWSLPEINEYMAARPIVAKDHHK